MANLNPECLDSGLDYITTNGTRIDICHTAEPSNYTEATATYTAGNETGMTTGAAGAGSPDGRAVIVEAITAGDVTATDDVEWWALTDGASIFLASGSLTALQAVTSGNTFTLDAITITYRDPTEV